MPILNPDYSNLKHEDMAAAIGLKVKYIPILIGSFLEESQTMLVSLEEAIDRNCYADIKLHAHSIKGSAGNLRFDAIYEMAKEMELSAASLISEFNYRAYLNAIKEAITTISV